MIATLNGCVLFKHSASLILDVNGVGYELSVSSRTADILPETGASCFLFVQTVLREDSLTLYGFISQEEKELFLLLVTVSGIGPKLALTILSGIGPEELCQAIMIKDIARLTSLPGVGKKTAQRICMELGEKVGQLPGAPPAGEGRQAVLDTAAGQILEDAASVLINLGYPGHLARQALRAVQKQLPETAAALKMEDLIRPALQFLAGGQDRQ